MHPTRPFTAGLTILLLITALTTGCSGSRIKTEIKQPAEGDPNYGQIESQKFHYNRRGDILRIDTTFTEENATRTGFRSQIDFYHKGAPWMYETRTTDENADASGLMIKREYRNPAGGIEKVEIMLTDESKWLFTGEMLDTFRMFPPIKLKSYNTAEAVVADIPGMTHVRNLKTVTPATPEQKALLKIWSENRDMAQTAGDFNASVQVEQDGTTYELLFNRQKEKEVTGRDNLLIFYNYIGNSGGKPVFLMLGYYNRL